MLADGRDPGYKKIDCNGHDADDPDRGAIVDTLVSEDNGEDNTTEVTTRTNYARDDTVVGRPDVYGTC
jgi:hypothetical protein